VYLLATPKNQNQGLVTRNAYCLSSDHHEESEFLAKPRRAKLQAIISIVVLLVKELTISCEARLGYDSL